MGNLHYKILELHDDEYRKQLDMFIDLEECDHNWISYMGLVESFTYCDKCNKKQD